MVLTGRDLVALAGNVTAIASKAIDLDLNTDEVEDHLIRMYENTDEVEPLLVNTFLSCKIPFFGKIPFFSENAFLELNHPFCRVASVFTLISISTEMDSWLNF